MKKNSILIAAFAVIVAASAAKAQTMDFDGTKGLKPQSMHEIFAGSNQFLPHEALAPIPEPVPVNTDETLMSMIEPWNIDQQDNCQQIEIAPGLYFPLCFVGDATSILKANHGIIHEVQANLKRAYPDYSAQPGFTAAMKALSGDKSTKILYNGKTLFFAKKTSTKWISDENLAAHAENPHPTYPPSDSEPILPNNGTNTSIGALGGSIAGSASGPLGTILGAIGGAIVGIAADIAAGS